MSRVGVIDYGIGNVASVIAAFDRIGVECVGLRNPNDLVSYSHLVLPGVGAFRAAMRNLEDQGWIDSITQYVNRGEALLGICLGVQILALESTEGMPSESVDLVGSKTEQQKGDNLPRSHSSNFGLGLLPFTVQSLRALGCDKRIPHTGWNTVRIVSESPLLAELPVEFDTYFVHSFGLEFVGAATIATTNYGCQFSAAVQVENVMGTQFHPEKSSKHGLHILKNFVAIG